MEKKNKEEILKKLEELVELIKNTDNYKRYIYLQEEMKKNKDLMSLIKSIKKKEQELVNKEYRKEDTSSLLKEIDNLNKELNTYPSYQEYIFLQEDINNDLQSVKNIIEKSINNS